MYYNQRHKSYNLDFRLFIGEHVGVAYDFQILSLSHIPSRQGDSVWRVFIHQTVFPHSGEAKGAQP